MGGSSGCYHLRQRVDWYHCFSLDFIQLASEAPQSKNLSTCKHSALSLTKPQRDVEDPSFPRSVQERIHLLSQSASAVRTKPFHLPKPTSFGVYLGPLDTLAAEEEVQILAQWDAVVLDYSEQGILDAVSNDGQALGPHIIARLDLLQMLTTSPTSHETDMLRAVYIVSKIAREALRQPDQARYFTGVLVAGWHERLSILMLNGIAKLLSAYGLDVFLEIGPPDYLTDVDKLNLKMFAGVVVRNGTILSTGERRDFFGMDKMKSTTKAFVSESCMRPFTVMMWDTVDDDVELSHAVARRAHMWCSYHGAVPFVTRQESLMDISQVHLCEEPLAAFQWLKDRKVMALHEKFRTTRTVSSFKSMDCLYGGFTDFLSYPLNFLVS